MAGACRSGAGTVTAPLALNARDVAMAAERAFPHERSGVQRRLRYALTHATTAGRAMSANDLTPAQLHRVHEHLIDLADGRMRYEVSAEGVLFWWPEGDGTTVLWSQLERTAVRS